MPSNPVFVFDGKLCKFEGMTKEQIINAIAQATGVTPSDVDAGFISTLLEQNKSRSIHVWKGTRYEYNALATKNTDTLYIIDDDTTIADFAAALDNMDTALDETIDGVQELQNNMMDAQRDIDDIEDAYDNDFVIGNLNGVSPNAGTKGWTTYSTNIASGLYVFVVCSKDELTTVKRASFAQFITTPVGSLFADVSSCFVINAIVSGSETDIECYLIAENDNNVNRTLKVIRKDNGDEIDCDILYHKIGSTTGAANDNA